jgi:catechol 2,3-dioxygenase-like lactoylglutathione lyase family enzyme
MELKRGRLIDHVHLRSQNLDAAKAFYEAVLGSLGIQVEITDTHLMADELWVDAGEQPSHVHLAFQAHDRDAVCRFYDAGIAAGGRDNGPPGERQYHPGYFAAFLLDPDGNNIEAVHHGAANRSAPAVAITW